LKINAKDPAISTVRGALSSGGGYRSRQKNRSLAVGLAELQARLKSVRALGGPYAGVDASEHLVALERATSSDETVALSGIQRVEGHRLAKDGETGRHFSNLEIETAPRRVAS
jgi:hypothetical protein